MSQQQQQINKTDINTSQQEQEKLLEDAKQVVKVQAFQMKRALDSNKLMEALKHASNLICELRTGLLSPKYYYELYIIVLDHLRYLEMYLGEDKHGKSLGELYELVQYAGNILPRLYLLITVGSVYVKSKKVPAKDVLHDLVEMCRGVQHPTRGLFLRNYLSEMTKDKLPDEGSEYHGAGGTVKDAVEFILSNFIEMNKLWVRLQHQAPQKDKEKREQERKELGLLIGKNLSRLSQLDGIKIEDYKLTVLPKILKQVISCKDKIAQQYLMEITIQVFSDDFHLQTLDQILKTCAQLTPEVEIKSIIVSLIDRLANYVSRSPNEVPGDIHIFDLFYENISTVVKSRSPMPLENVLALQVSLLNLSLKVYPNQHDYVDKVLGFCAEQLNQNQQSSKELSKNAIKEIFRLLRIPQDVYKNVLLVLNLENYAKVTNVLSFLDRRKISLDIVQNAIDNDTKISSGDEVEKLFSFITPLLKDETDQKETVNDTDFEEEQHLVSRLVHLVQNPNVEALYGAYIKAKSQFDLGGKRKKFTLVPLLFSGLRLAQRIHNGRLKDENWEKKIRAILKFANDCITGIKQTPNSSSLVVKLYLECGLVAGKCGIDNFAYEFLTQAYNLYEEDIADSKEKFATINYIVNVLYQVDCFNEEQRDPLVTQTVQYAAKLVKKPDQCRGLFMCTHLLWVEYNDAKPPKKIKDGKRVHDWLTRAMKVAGSVGELEGTSNLALFVEGLDRCLYYYENKNEAVTTDFVNKLIKHVKTKIEEAGSSENNSNVNLHLNNILKHIQWKRQNDARYEAITI